MFFTRSRALLAGLSLLAGSAIVTLAQQTPEFRVGVNIVNVLATVRDRDGRIVTNLSKEDFVLEEDGKPQQITNFFRQTDLPLTIGLLIDTSISQRRLIAREQSAGRKFFDHVLRPQRDLAFLIQFDSDVLMLQDLTPSQAELENALERLEVPGRRRGGFAPRRLGRSDLAGSGVGPGDAQFPGGQPWPGGGGQTPPIGGPPQGRPAGTLLYDAVFLAADEVLRNEAGRKTIIIISDGVDQGSKVSEKEAIETVQRADCLIYSVRYFDEEAYGGRWGGGFGAGSEGRSTLQDLSSQTGGRMYEVSKKLSLEAIFDQIQEELRSQYSLSYSPAPGSPDRFRKIKLRTRDKSLKVVTRAGYYPKKS
ncbi:MAG: VWA domain-containing protein [Acidobacteria bacterium]|nr:MAG: VWA domain-containing protein [Acidobacteriota bacterium]